MLVTRGRRYMATCSAYGTPRISNRKPSYKNDGRKKEFGSMVQKRCFIEDRCIQ